MPDYHDLPMLRTSERISFKRCPQQWWWGWREGLTQTGPPALPLWFGAGWHLVMAHIYSGPGLKRGKTPLKVWREYVDDDIAKIRINLRGEDWKEETYINAKELGEIMVGNYLDTYGKDPTWHIIQPEKPFEVIIKSPAGVQKVLYCGTYDLIYRDLTDNSIWLGEHKTAKAIMIHHLQLDDQAGSYWAIATSELRAAKLIGPRENLRGIMYNFARKGIPDDRPKDEDGRSLNKDGSVSKNQPSPLLKRERVFRTAKERNTQIGRIQAEVAAMDNFRSGENLYKNPTKDCSWGCNFYQLCMLHEQGADFEEYKKAMFRTRDPYEAHRDIRDEDS